MAGDVRVVDLDAPDSLDVRPTARVDDRTPGLVQGLSHFGVAFVHLANVDVAPVQLEHVYAPLGERVSIGFQVVQAARVAGAGACAIVLIYSKLDTLGVDVVDQGLHAMREAGWIANKTAWK